MVRFSLQSWQLNRLEEGVEPKIPSGRWNVKAKSSLKDRIIAKMPSQQPLRNKSVDGLVLIRETGQRGMDDLSKRLGRKGLVFPVALHCRLHSATQLPCHLGKLVNLCEPVSSSV